MRKFMFLASVAILATLALVEDSNAGLLRRRCGGERRTLLRSRGGGLCGLGAGCPACFLAR